MPNSQYALGTVEASEQLIRDLYIDLRKKVRTWAGLTKQTAQARMGYVEQHLVSVATGFPGGRSGARGMDLILPNKEFAEIKTCYRVDQLGMCYACGAGVASIEEICPTCSSKEVRRNDDSKWLIGIRSAAEFEELLDPKYYFLVLFDFVDIGKDDRRIQASIWRVDSLAPGFALCMIDYYLNIHSKSKSKAPFNLWPYELKFVLMRPLLIYRSFIDLDDTIHTTIFPGRDVASLHPIEPLPEYSRSQNLTEDKIWDLSRVLNVSQKMKQSKKEMLIVLHTKIERMKLDPIHLADTMAKALYLNEIKPKITTLPKKYQEYIRRL